MNIDDEILQDFLVEAGELYDLLNDQLSDLEKDPQDTELLNAIFRAFHTIKGGAGFLALLPMVELCHRAEDVFDKLRKQELFVDASLIDVMFQVLDVLGDMFDSMRDGEPQQDADASLLNKLDGYLTVDKNSNVSAQASDDDITTDHATDLSTSDNKSSMTLEEEFEQVRQATLNVDSENNTNKSSSSGLISDEEFDNLLDEIHGEGKHSVVTESTVPNDSASFDSDVITDDEFESILDQMHGENKGPGSSPSTPLVTDDKSQPQVSVSRDDAAESNIKSDIKIPDTKKTSGQKSDSKKKDTSKKETSVRVDTERLDEIMNLVGELVLVRNRLSMLKQDMKQDHVSEAISTLELITTDLQASVMKTRMQPIKKVFSRFPRVIRDLAKKLNKEINLELVGEETDLDKSLVEALADPLIHLVRNSADHGIETPEERYASGKARQGTITLSAKQEGDQILLTVSDDGKGMDATVFRRKAVETGMFSEDVAANLSDKDAFNLIFAPGFSTKSEISDVSGRGVGMDVVKTRINELNGSIEIDSTLGTGSVITIMLPLTLAILPTLMVKLDAYQFAMPLNNVYEAFNMEPDKINVVDNQEVIGVRGETLPLYYLYPWLVRNASFDGPNVNHKVIVVQMGGFRICLVVDEIIGQEEVVIKPLGTMLNTTPGFSGATITGDGDIALVLDMPGLMNEYSANNAVC